MATQAEILTKIQAIDAKLASGVRTVSVDGTSTSLDLVELHRERTRLEKQLQATRARRPPSARINLGGF